MDYQVHETAIVDEGAKIGTNSKIWHWTHVCAGAVLRKTVSLGQNVSVGNKVNVGDNCKIQNNVPVYDTEPLKGDVFSGPSVLFTHVLHAREFIVRKI